MSRFKEAAKHAARVTAIAGAIALPGTRAVNFEPTLAKTAVDCAGDPKTGVKDPIKETFRAEEALDYPSLVTPDPSRMPVFPDVPTEGHRPLVAYETPYEDGDYFEDCKGDIDLPQFNYRVITAGHIKIPDLNIDLTGDDDTGVAVILINHFGETAMFRDSEVDNGFTIAGRVFDMSKPEMVTEAGQALLDHYMGRMTDSPDGANCGTIDACKDVKWVVAVVGNGELQVKWEGTFDKTQKNTQAFGLTQEGVVFTYPVSETKKSLNA